MCVWPVVWSWGWRGSSVCRLCCSAACCCCRYSCCTLEAPLSGVTADTAPSEGSDHGLGSSGAELCSATSWFRLSWPA